MRSRLSAFTVSALILGWMAGAAAQNNIVPTAPPGTNNSQAASTAFVQNAISGGALTVGTTPVFGGLSTQCLFINGSLLGSQACTPPSNTITIGNTAISGGSAGQVIYDNNGVAGEYTPGQLTAQINAFTSLLAGAVPASGGGTTNFLRADGTFAAPAYPVTSVINSDGTLTISPTTGNVVASLALGHPNIWSGAQTFSAGDLILKGASSGGLTINCAAANTASVTAVNGAWGAFAATGSGNPLTMMEMI